MSSSARYRYELERQRRQELALARMRSTTQMFLERYRSILANVRRDELEQFAPQETESLERAVERVAALLATDPEAARDLSQSIAAEVHALPRIAREAQRAAAAAVAEQIRRQQEDKARARQELDATWRALVAGWKDSLARDLAFEGLRALRTQFLTEDPVEGTSVALATELQALRMRSEAQANAIRAEKAATTRVDAQQDAIESTLTLTAQSEQDAPSAVQGARDALADAASLPADDLAARLTEAARQVDAAVIDERCRREVVRGVVQALREAGFITESPWRRVEGGLDEVVVRARRAAGSQAEFRVTVSGDLAYTFDNYEGAACKKDIGTVLPKLEEIYGVRLSNQRVVWENPDDLDKTAASRPDGSTEGGHVK